ncbi:MAG: hypothetical protein J6U54_10870 [Clostridiales bacterium]|nr:hypothetical protein [Clostridiales bacterium]
MKKLISLLLIGTMVFTATSCSHGKDSNRKKSKDRKKIEKEEPDEEVTDFDELKKYDGIMFNAHNGNWGLEDASQDYWVSDNYTVYYDGTMEVRVSYNLSDSVVRLFELSDEDYKAIYAFAHDAYVNDSFSDYKEDACDGEYWSFDFYDTDGEEHELYYGYTYANESMNEIQDILYNYRSSESFVVAPIDTGLDIEKSSDLMFVASNSNWGLNSLMDDFWSYDYFKLYYDGTLEISVVYNISGFDTQIVTISDDDLKTIYDFAYDAYANDTYKDYNEDASDGESWSFSYFDQEGDEYAIYSGYTYGNESMIEIEEILHKYMQTVVFDLEIPQQGPMLEVTDTYQGPLDYSSDEICGLKYVVNYDRTLDFYEIYTNSGEVFVKTIDIEDYSFIQFRNFCSDSVIHETYKDYFEYVDDGATFRFVYYDNENTPYEIYDGYIYDNTDLTMLRYDLEFLVNQ